MLGRAAIARLIPHQGSMCLLDRAESWDAASILCRSAAHRDPANPLRRDGRLASVCAVELGFQAMALHGALTGGGPQPRGLVSSLREVDVALPFIDDLPGDLAVRATLLAAEARGYAYAFAVAAGDGRPVVAGRATIILPVAGPSS